MVLEVGEYDKYKVKVDGSERNRQFLRQVQPNQPQQPVQRAQVQPDQEVQGDRLLDRVVGQVHNQEQTLQEHAMPEQFSQDVRRSGRVRKTNI